MDRAEFRFGCIERATALSVRCGKGDIKAFAETFYRFVGDDPQKLRALDIALTRANHRGAADWYVKFAAVIMEFVNRKDTSGAPDTPACT
ncbi:MAG: hypothetical protein IH974_01075 [Myxococcales bacterium]|nr:hypothetical protein [Myxococcales bacterium]